MKLVITGALGHIGSRLIRELQPAEFGEVLLIDDLSAQRYGSLFELPAAIRWRFVEGDVASGSLELEPLFSGARAVVHLAAVTNAAASFEMQKEVERVNFVGTERVARACARTGSRLFFPSTTSVYGVSSGMVDEACPPEALKPQSPYAESKIRAERMLAQLGRDLGLRYFAGRLGTIYGASPGMRFHTAVNKFIWQACVGQPLTVWRTAMDQRRPYLDVGDAVEAIRFVLRGDLFNGHVYNVLTENLTVRQIVDAIREQVGDLRVELVDTRIMNQLSYEVDRRKFEALGFGFRGDLHRGIRETVALLRALIRS
jgi:nucleoside-diphosphate-sugar epimerase